MAALQGIKDQKQEAAVAAYKNKGQTIAVNINPKKTATPRYTDGNTNGKAKK